MVGDGRNEGSSAQETERGKMQLQSHLTLMAQVLTPCWTQLYLSVPSREKDPVMSG